MAAIVCLASGSMPQCQKEPAYTMLENGGDLYRCVNAGWKYVHSLSGTKRVRIWYSNKERQEPLDAGSEFAGCICGATASSTASFPI